LLRTAERLRALAPSFVSVTYGAGGSTRRNTIEITARLQRELGLTAMAHLTCVGHSRAELEEILREIRQRGIENLMCLRGDPPRGRTDFVPAPDGFAHAYELIQLARSVDDFCIGAAAYPEGHVECRDPVKNLEHLALKAESGADFFVTQMFFDNRDYFDFVERARRFGIRQRIIPGIMPALSWGQIQRMAQLSGASIPPGLARELEAAGEDREAAARIGIEHARRQCEDLLAGGAPGIHFYTLNQSRATEEIFAFLRANLANWLPAAPN
jgi:methylenetetrahydrofolate reductase (NADPH)